MSFVNWVIDTLGNMEIIDLYFILSDLFEINLTPGEIVETAENDSLCMEIFQETGGDDFDPFRPSTWPDYSGKEVF